MENKNILENAKFGDKFKSEHGYTYVYVDSRMRFVPCENKRFKVYYFVKLGDCIDYDEYDVVQGLNYLRYDSYFDEYEYDDSLVEKL